MSQPSGNPYPQQPYGEQPAPQQPGGYPPPAGQPYGAPSAAPLPPKKSKAGKIVLIVLAVVLVLCLGGAAITWFAVKDEVGDVVDATKTRVTAPATLAGRKQVTDPELTKLSDELVADMKSTVQNETSTAGAFYGDAAKQDLVMIAAASGVLADPKKELDDAIAGLKTQLTVQEMTATEPGPLGGEARCGDGKTAGMPLGVCVWADRGSLGMIVVFFKSAKQAEAEFVTMRGQIEQRS
ncbi:hypothetical protein [Micromonospora carbonacea]|uniref:Flagellar basal body-associated protein FliL n=1 Tax=Micromonospora carbonacea TaxID=47853 RepID=A0A1C4WMZ6_9ACTN|nr:hypothetical protein [Micromonospora carbonacea]SCE97538.1 hypothetical protein GA0070563_103491 [Micromonospora carbonacea]